MTIDHAQILLIASNARRRYAEDILAAVASPRGAILQFRYQDRYVSPTLQQIVRSGEALGKTALVAFAGSGGEPFFVPIRLAIIVEAKIVSDIFFIRFAMNDYVDLSQYVSSLPDLRSTSDLYLRRLRDMNGGEYFPAVTRFPIVERAGTGANDGDDWLAIVKRLDMHDTYKDSHFLRVDNPLPLKQGDAPLALKDDGVLHLREERPFKLVAHFYSEEYDSSEKSIACDTDNAYLRVSSSAQYAVSSRYDSVEFWLQPALVNFPTLSRVSVSVSNGNTTDPSTRVEFSVVVERARGHLAARASLGATGALLLALPAMLGADSALWLRVLLGIAGALIVSYVTVYMSAGRK